jgi:hypothetical protein
MDQVEVRGERFEEGDEYVQQLEMGMDLRRLGDRLFDLALGRLYFRNWSEQSLHGLRRAARAERKRVGA